MRGETDHTVSKHYIFTKDLPGKVQYLNTHFGLEVPGIDDPIFEEIDGELVNLIEALLSEDTKIVPIDMHDLAREMASKALAYDPNKKLGKSTIVGTCREVADMSNGYVINVNRIIDPTGTSLPINSNGGGKKLGPRPGFHSIDRQIASIAQLSPIVLVEDGSFSGGTVKFLLERFAAARIPVNALVIGIAFPEALEVINETFRGDLIIAGVEECDGSKLVDWMPDHDFLPFVPNCGKVVGYETNGYLYPHYNMEGYSYAVPYLTPFISREMFRDWTGLPMDLERDDPRLGNIARIFSMKCVELSQKLYKHLAKLNDRELCIGDLQSGYRHVSIPFMIGAHHYFDKETSVLDALSIIHEGLTED